jgi:KEOPS complex subunit Cgi121
VSGSDPGVDASDCDVRLVEATATVDDLDAFLAALDDVATTYGTTVQAFDARYVTSRDHLLRAVELADRAFARGENVARERAVEVLLFAAGRRQIDRALKMGVSTGEGPVVVVVADNGGGDVDGAATAVAGLDELTPASTLGAFDPELVRSFFDVGDAELAAVEGDIADVVAERVALLVVER